MQISSCQCYFTNYRIIISEGRSTQVFYSGKSTPLLHSCNEHNTKVKVWEYNQQNVLQILKVLSADYYYSYYYCYIITLLSP